MTGFRESLPDIGVRIRASDGGTFDDLIRDSASAGDKVARNLTSGTARGIGKMGHIGLNAGKALAGGFAIGVTGIGALAAVEFSKATDEASNLIESVNKSRVVFDKSSKGVERWAKTTSKYLGISRVSALESASTFGNLFSGAGFDDKTSAKVSRDLVHMAGGMASFNNADPAEALEALRSGLVGETEPLRRFGVNLSAVKVQAEAARLGLVKTTVDMTKVKDAQLKVAEAQKKANDAANDSKATDLDRRRAVQNVRNAEKNLATVMKGKVGVMSDQAKMQATYSLVMKKAANQYDDAIRSGDTSLEVQKSRTKARIADIQATIGTSLMPGRLEFQKQLNSEVIPALESAVSANKGRLKSASGVLSDALVPATVTGIDWVSTDGIDHLEDFLKWIKTDGVSAAKGLSDEIKHSLWPHVKDLGGTVRDDVFPVFDDWKDILVPLADDALPALNTVLTGTRDILKVVAPLAGDLLDAFNGLPDGVKKTMGIGAAAALLSKRMTGGKTATFGLAPMVKWLRKRSGDATDEMVGRGSVTNPMWVKVVGSGLPGPSVPGSPTVPTPVGEMSLPKKILNFGANASATLAAVEGTNWVLEKIFNDKTSKGEVPAAVQDLIAGKDPGPVAASVSDINSSAAHAEHNAIGFLPGGTRWGDAEETINNLDEALANLVNSGNIDDAKKAMDTIVSLGDSKGIGAEESTKWFDKYNAAMDAINDAKQRQLDASQTQLDAENRAARLQERLARMRSRIPASIRAPESKPGILDSLIYGGARAKGGPVDPGKFYLAGEHGPEIIAPRSAGHVLTARETAQIMAGRGGSSRSTTYAPTINHNYGGVHARLTGSVDDVNRGLRDMAARTQRY